MLCLNKRRFQRKSELRMESELLNERLLSAIHQIQSSFYLELVQGKKSDFAALFDPNKAHNSNSQRILRLSTQESNSGICGIVIVILNQYHIKW